MSDITNEQKREIKEFVEAQSDQWTDFVSMLDATLHLYGEGVSTPPSAPDAPTKDKEQV